MIRQVRLSSLFALLVLFAGLGLRLWEPALIEFKRDEAYTYASTRGEAGLEAFPALGMPSGAGGLVNPGLSIWAFSGPARLLGLDTPEKLAGFVGLGFLLSLSLLLVYTLRNRKLSEVDKQSWIWAVSASAASPVLLLYTRKIWAQSLLPLLSIPIFVLWMERHRHPALRALLIAFCVLIGQLHMSGFFLGFAFLLLEFREAILRRTPWWPLLVGGLVATLPMLPWIVEIFSETGARNLQTALGVDAGRWPEFLKFRYWSYVLSFGSGLNFTSSFGADVRRLFSSPLLVVSVLASLALLIVLLRRAFQRLLQSLRSQWRRPMRLKSFDALTPTSQLLWIGIFLCGILMTLSNVRIHRHYLIVLTPLLSLGLTKLAFVLFPRRALLGLGLYTLLQLVISFEILKFLDSNRGAPGADFGVAYKYQPESKKERRP